MGTASQVQYLENHPSINKQLRIIRQNIWDLQERAVHCKRISPCMIIFIRSLHIKQKQIIQWPEQSLETVEFHANSGRMQPNQTAALFGRAFRKLLLNSKTLQSSTDFA